MGGSRESACDETAPTIVAGSDQLQDRRFWWTELTKRGKVDGLIWKVRWILQDPRIFLLFALTFWVHAATQAGNESNTCLITCGLKWGRGNVDAQSHQTGMSES